jgi:hypothetical protein
MRIAAPHQASPQNTAKTRRRQIKPKQLSLALAEPKRVVPTV